MVRALGDETPLIVKFLLPDGYSQLMSGVESIKYLGLVQLNNVKTQRFKLTFPQREIELVFKASDQPLLMQTATHVYLLRRPEQYRV